MFVGLTEGNIEASEWVELSSPVSRDPRSLVTQDDTHFVEHLKASRPRRYW